MTLKKDINQQLEKKGMNVVEGTFMRKGKAGNWKDHFTPKLEERFKEWEAKSLMGSSLKFEYDV